MRSAEPGHDVDTGRRARERLLFCTILPLLVVFAEPDFPVHGVALSLPEVEGAVVCTSVAELERELTPDRVLVWRHGSTFPAEAWPAFVKFLEGGGSFLHLGGEPFTRPVTGRPGARMIQPRTVSLLKVLRLNQCHDLAAGHATLEYVPGLPGHPPPGRKLSKGAHVSVLEPRLTDTRDFANEDGAPGARDAILRPLAFVRRPYDDPRFPFASGAFAIDRYRGRFAGGRWVFRLVSEPVPKAELDYLIDRARREPIDFRVDPTFGCFHDGEAHTLLIRVHRPRARGAEDLKFDLVVRGPDGKVVWRDVDRPLRAGVHGSMPYRLGMLDKKPGLYRVTANLPGRRPYETGFWIFDEGLFTSGDTLTFDDYTLRRNGKPEPVIGTTVMSATVHRKFLFEPNAAVWDDTFAELASLDVNLVRTGIWSGFRKISLDPNVVDEAWLRALEAYYLTARKHGIPVLFTFFAFVPEAFGGKNPYLDPRAVEGQRAYLSAVASRFKDAKEILWDLINEPSFSNPKKLWQCRPTGDRFEKAAFLEWLKRRYGNADDPRDESWKDVVRSRWRLTPDEPIGLPTEDDFQDRNTFGPHRPYRAREYCHFAQDAFAGWIRQMTAAIREAGSTAAITVGQDEGGLHDRPGPLFHHRAVDFTSIHTWWLNDALFWDGVMAKAPGKPLLVSETGVMQRERLSGEALRTPETAARLLSRKIGNAFAAGAFGMVQWCYDVNPYMDLDNEVAIGLRRVDGSYKPEHEVVREFAAFFARNKEHLHGLRPAETVLVVPHGDHFSPRGLQERGIRRALEHISANCFRPIQLVSEYRTSEDLGTPRAILLPACRGISDRAWKDLLEAVRNGATLLCSGWFEADDAGRPAHRIGTPEKPLGRRELGEVEYYDQPGLRLDPSQALRYPRAVTQSAYAADVDDFVRRIPLGKGEIVHHRVPIEWAEPGSAALSWYENLPTGVLFVRSWTGPDFYFLRLGKSHLLIVINTLNRTAEQRISFEEDYHFTVPAGRARMFLFDENQELIDRSHPDPARHVDPLIGTGGHGHTYPGASRPFGMVQVSPDTRLTGWDGCSGYHYTDEYVYGFSHTHLSGTGVPDYCDILLMPTTGEVRYNNGADGNPGYRSRFERGESGYGPERAEAGYYRVGLTDAGIHVELTATARCAFHRYVWDPGTREVNVIFDLVHRDTVLDSSIEIVGDREVRGHRRSASWAEDQVVYFVARFSRPFASFGVAKKDQAGPGRTARGKHVKAHVRFDDRDAPLVLVKVGLSAVSLEGAARNLEAEIPEWNFDQVRLAARAAWNRQLAKIEIEGGTEAEQRTFYTALYHACLNPNLFMDVDGRYRGMDRKIHQAEGYDHYTIFSLWDTFRAAHPLFTLIEPERTRHFIRTMLAHYREGGALPVWELAGNETHCMIGYHAVPVIADAYAKGIRDGYDPEAAFRAMVASGDRDQPGLDAYRRHGFVPAEVESGSVSKTLEYAYDDWCIAQVARALGKTEEHRRFLERAQSYKNLFDPATGFFRAKVNHAFVEPFDPCEVNQHFTEANAWQYAFFVPQDVDGLIALNGGREKFIEKLDMLFAMPSKTTGRKQVDITGLIGQYAHGNEPSHHMAYLYCFAGAPWKTQQRVREILNRFYSDQPDGLSGNEDCGQMSAWYVLSALGFYPVTPGSTQYVIGAPLFPRATLRLESGKTFTVRAEGVSKTNIYVQRATLNGEPFDRAWIDHAEILAGGELVFVMGAEPNREWATSEAARPRSRITEHRIVPVPFVEHGARTFKESMKITFGALPEVDAIRYLVDGGKTLKPYRGPIPIQETTTLGAYAVRGRHMSRTIQATFTKIAAIGRIALFTHYAPQYAAGGDQALVDGLRGGPDFRTGAWQGFHGVDLGAVVDLGKVRDVKRITVNCLQDRRSWIWMPTEVRFSLSEDGEEYRVIGTKKNTVDERASGAIIKGFAIYLDARARYVQIVARNRGTCPDWHPGAGRKAWIFADEITVE